MDLTPRHIQEKQFNDAFRGYGHEEVDLFLDEVAEAFEKVFRENQTFHQRYKQLEEELQQAKGTEDMLKRTLITAQRTAEEAVEEAKQKAQGMIVAAERKSQEIVATAERKAQEIIADAHLKERELQGTVEGLKRFDQEYRARLRAFIESQLNVLSEGPVPQSFAPPASPPSPARAEESPTEKVPTEQAEFAPHVSPVPIESESNETKIPTDTRTAHEEAAVAAVPSRGVPPSGPSGPGGRAAAESQGSQGPPGRSDEARPEPGDAEEKREQPGDEDDQTIKKLFWGED